MANAAGSVQRRKDPILVTASDRKYFLLTFLLSHTLRRFAPDLSLHVLDFGLDDAQRKFLAAFCTVVPRPADMAAGLHPFIYKSHMARFLQRVKWRSMVWIDADMIAVAPLTEPLSALLAAMAAGKHEVAIGREAGEATLATIVSGGPQFDHFARVVAGEGTDLATPYYNTGIFACRSPAFLSDWSERALYEPPQALFDQNIFNLVLHRRGAPLPMATNVWNVHDALLADARVAGTTGAPRVSVGGTPTLIVHVTSSRRDDIVNAPFLDVGGIRLPGQMYFCRNPELKALQEAVIAEAFIPVADRLRRLGLGQPAAAGQ